VQHRGRVSDARDVFSQRSGHSDITIASYPIQRPYSPPRMTVFHACGRVRPVTRISAGHRSAANGVGARRFCAQTVWALEVFAPYYDLHRQSFCWDASTVERPRARWMAAASAAPMRPRLAAMAAAVARRQQSIESQDKPHELKSMNESEGCLLHVKADGHGPAAGRSRRPSA
jgi:hypothetical protein